MLKIKDNVDLKELEKFGFCRKYIFGDWAWEIDFKKDKYEENIIIWEEDRNIQARCIQLMEVMYDLIKADLVEKSIWILKENKQ